MQSSGDSTSEAKMSLVIDLPKDVEADLASQARSAEMPTETYVARLVERAIQNRRRQGVKDLERHLDVMASRVAPDTTPEEMEAALEEALTAVRPRRSYGS